MTAGPNAFAVFGEPHLTQAPHPDAAFNDEPTGFTGPGMEGTGAEPLDSTAFGGNTSTVIEAIFIHARQHSTHTSTHDTSHSVRVGVTERLSERESRTAWWKENPAVVVCQVATTMTVRGGVGVAWKETVTSIADLPEVRQALNQLTLEATRLDAQIEELKRERADLERRLTGLRDFVGTASDEASPVINPEPVLTGRRVQNDTNLSPHIRALLKDLGRPASIEEMLTMLPSRGVVVPGQNPRHNLASHVFRTSGLERVGRGLYRLIELSDA